MDWCSWLQLCSQQVVELRRERGHLVTTLSGADALSPYCIPEQGPEVLISRSIVTITGWLITTEWLLWKKPTNNQTSQMICLILIYSFSPLENVLSILLIQSMFIVKFYYAFVYRKAILIVPKPVF